MYNKTIWLVKWNEGDDILPAIIHSFALKTLAIIVISLLSYGNVNSIAAMLFQRHLRWIWSDVLSIRRAEKEWMAGRLPVKSLRVYIVFGLLLSHAVVWLDLICPATPCTALCRPSSNLQHQAQDASRNSSALVQVCATWDAAGGCVFVSFISLHKWKRWDSARQTQYYSSVITSVAS